MRVLRVGYATEKATTSYFEVSGTLLLFVNLIYTQYTPQLAWKFDYLVGMRREMRVYIHGEPNLKTALNKFYST
jgi:hypothetical protein